MPTSDAYNKTDRLQQIQLLFWKNPGRQFRTSELAEILNVSQDTVTLDLNGLSRDGRLPVIKEGWYWKLAKDANFDLLPVKLNLPEGTALYLAARLLTQIHDEQNTIVPHQHAIVDMARERQKGQLDTSGIFEALALGWATHRVVRLIYSPPRKKTFECLFSPYLLEPSGIGRTIYAIGQSQPPGALRTFKLERIEHAALTDATFEVPADFDGPALLTNAWGVMYGDEEPVEVRLCFSHWVTKRVHETLWHPSQQIVDTPEGCIWTAQIADTLEIENWIRGWGSDCEVIAPLNLRESIIDHAHRMARMYGITVQQSASLEQSDDDLFDTFFGE